MNQQVINGYSDAAVELVSRYEAISPPELYVHVAHLLPEAGARVLDIGAGTGRDASWLASRGCDVLAVEPTAEFRAAGAALHPSSRIEWLNDSLPMLAQVLERDAVFDFVMLSGVWQHIDAEARGTAMRNFRALTAPGGRLLLSVRHGPGAPTRPCFPARAEDTIALAQAEGFRLLFHHSAESIQPQNRAAGVTWTWLVFS